MEIITEFIWAGLAGGGLSAGLITTAAVLGRSQLAHWLNKEIENIKAQHQKDLEGAKATYARELESYRTSLIAQAESIKANQEVRKAVALLVAQKEFEAVNNLHAASLGLASLGYSVWRSVEKDKPNQQLTEFQERIVALDVAMHQATFFWSKSKQRAALQQYNAMIFSLQRECLDLDRVTGGIAGSEMEEQIVKADNALDEMIRGVLSSMKSMDP